MNRLILGALLLVACDESEEERTRRTNDEYLGEQLTLLHDSTNIHARHSALSSIVFYCQQRNVEAACLELTYQLVWGGRDNIELIGEYAPVGLGKWQGKIPEVVWWVAFKTATTEHRRDAFRRAIFSYPPPHSMPLQ